MIFLLDFLLERQFKGLPVSFPALQAPFAKLSMIEGKNFLPLGPKLFCLE